ncbi:hypothetical protein TRFO_19094 [Tritrichomonas foetus]|uniref:Uncharacterized protein n=1 Tax=Tritrichomonas foetus TaxID=1144522 RepID=A0A1J4KKJ5_9EUKA|nr:hypothetical protein TRFO_19094 [Tritrichomonas foetus]|eukprot:OHT11456.1 hypothetical protein TRFO_19094 [Tritrichomonas foetus]
MKKLILYMHSILIRPHFSMINLTLSSLSLISSISHAPLFSPPLSVINTRLSISNSNFARFFAQSLLTHANNILLSYENTKFSHFLSSAFMIDSIDECKQNLYETYYHQFTETMNFTKNEVIVRSCQFLNCHSQENGGAFSIRNSQNVLWLTLTSLFQCTTEGESGGGFFLETKTNKLNSVCFYQCSANLYGGAYFAISTIEHTSEWVSVVQCPYDKPMLSHCCFNLGGGQLHMSQNISFNKYQNVGGFSRINANFSMVHFGVYSNNIAGNFLYIDNINRYLMQNHEFFNVINNTFADFGLQQEWPPSLILAHNAQVFVKNMIFLNNTNMPIVHLIKNETTYMIPFVELEDCWFDTMENMNMVENMKDPVHYLATVKNCNTFNEKTVFQTYEMRLLSTHGCEAPYVETRTFLPHEWVHVSEEGQQAVNKSFHMFGKHLPGEVDD